MNPWFTIARKPRLTMNEAVMLGYTRDHLRGLVRSGHLENVGTPARYRFRRRDLDGLWKLPLHATMAEAVMLGFSRDHLRDLVKAGKLENFGRDINRYIFRRADLDAL